VTHLGQVEVAVRAPATTEKRQYKRLVHLAWQEMKRLAVGIPDRERRRAHTRQQGLDLVCTGMDIFSLACAGNTACGADH